MTSIQDVEQVADDLESLVAELRSELKKGADFERLTQISDEISEHADNAAQTFPPTIVSRDRVPQAVRLNTFGLTVSRTVGPALAGVLLSVSSPSVVFALNASTFVLYLAILYAYVGKIVVT